MKIERFLVQYLAQSGAWLDCVDVDGRLMLFDCEDIAGSYARSALANTRVVKLEGEVRP